MHPVIHAYQLTKRYGDTLAVDQVDFTVYPGEIFGFLGPNGAGKTTTIKMLIGLLQPTSGTAFIAGHDIQREPLQAKAAFGYVPDQPQLPEKLTAREYLQFIAGLYRIAPATAMQRATEYLTMFDLLERADDLLGGYSHGMQQKAAVTGALLHQPRALLLDEPTVGLDPRSARLMKDVLRTMAAEGTAIMLTTHILEIAERLCHRVAIINQGRIIAMGTLDELRHTTTETSLEDIFLELTGGPAYAELAARLDE